jgi:competence protein ComEA
MKSRISMLVLIALAAALTLPVIALADDATPSTPATGSTMAKPAAKAKAATMAHPRIDLNTATKEELMKEPGVTDETAEKIIAARPFKSRAELLSKKLVTRAEYAKLRTHVMVKPATEEKKG